MSEEEKKEREKTPHDLIAEAIMAADDGLWVTGELEKISDLLKPNEQSDLQTVKELQSSARDLLLTILRSHANKRAKKKPISKI